LHQHHCQRGFQFTLKQCINANGRKCNVAFLQKFRTIGSIGGNEGIGPILEGCHMPQSDIYQKALHNSKEQCKILEERLNDVRDGKTKILKSRKKHLDRGKLLVRQRIDLLRDAGTSFLELSPLAGFEDGIPSGGIITGIIKINGIQCMVVGNDATVKGGTYSPITVKNIYVHKK